MKIWFNQSFSMRNVIARMVRDRPLVELSVSAIDPDAPVRDVAPEFWEEPPRGAAGYAEWVLETAIRRGVDAIVPQRGRAEIVGLASEFRRAGIDLHVAGDRDTLALLEDKAAFSAMLERDAFLCPTKSVGTAAEFDAAVRAITADGAHACVKPSMGVYGAGYWTLTADGPFDHLADPDSRRVSVEMYAAALRESEARGERFSLLVMEHLPGLEASVDIVADRGSVLLAAVRTKLDANRQHIQTRHPLIAHAARLVGRFALHGALNVQYKRDRKGDWRILEINARAAGGASYCDEAGVPFSATWLDVVSGAARPFDTDIDAEIVAVIRAEPRKASQNGSAGTSQA